jgi:hypothetical protein
MVAGPGPSSLDVTQLLQLEPSLLIVAHALWSPSGQTGSEP